MPQPPNSASISNESYYPAKVICTVVVTVVAIAALALGITGLATHSNQLPQFIKPAFEAIGYKGSIGFIVAGGCGLGVFVLLHLKKKPKENSEEAANNQGSKEVTNNQDSTEVAKNQDVTADIIENSIKMRTKHNDVVCIELKSSFDRYYLGRDNAVKFLVKTVSCYEDSEGLRCYEDSERCHIFSKNTNGELTIYHTFKKDMNFNSVLKNPVLIFEYWCAKLICRQENLNKLILMNWGPYNNKKFLLVEKDTENYYVFDSLDEAIKKVKTVNEDNIIYPDPP